MGKGYWHQRASTWVSAAVLAGGLVVVVLLVFVYRAENNLQLTSFSSDDLSELERN